MIPLILFILFIALIDIYSFIGLKQTLHIPSLKLFYSSFAISSILTLIGVILLIIASLKGYSNIPLHVNLLFGLSFSIIMAKLFMTSFFLIEDIFRGFAWLFESAIKFRGAELLNRSNLLGKFILGFGFITVIIINYGVLVERYNFKVRHVKLSYDKLPKSFDGFKIAHISDLHLGTFDQIKRVKKGLKKLQDQNPDLILFTGDMVNNNANEASIFINSFNSVNAPFGKFSILGNHDYGEYVKWENASDKLKNLENLKNIAKQMGFIGLYNSTIPIEKNNDTIFISGVENWGTLPFPQYGDLEKALNGLNENDFIILLSHDPSHWREQVLNHIVVPDLTLSGHTHGMQFGIEIGEFRWSPVKYRYAEWAGLYTEGIKKLYVNRGFGSIGYPGRVGIKPEITIIELNRTMDQ